MDVRNLLAAFVVGCATTACALDVAPDAGDKTDTTVSRAAIPVGTGAEPGTRGGPPCDAMLRLDSTGKLVVTGYLCPQPEVRHPDPEMGDPRDGLPGELPEQAQQSTSATSPR